MPKTFGDLKRNSRSFLEKVSEQLAKVTNSNFFDRSKLVGRGDDDDEIDEYEDVVAATAVT